MGGVEAVLAGTVEPTVKYHPARGWRLTQLQEAGVGTAAGGQFDWGGRLLKSNGGAQRFPQAGWKSAAECIGIRELDCEADMPSRNESWAK